MHANEFRDSIYQTHVSWFSARNWTPSSVFGPVRTIRRKSEFSVCKKVKFCGGNHHSFGFRNPVRTWRCEIWFSERCQLVTWEPYILILVALRAIVVKAQWIHVASARIHLAQIKWREVIRSLSFGNPYVAELNDTITDGCHGTKDFSRLTRFLQPPKLVDGIFEVSLPLQKFCWV